LFLSLFSRWPSSLFINLFGVELKTHWDTLLNETASQAALHEALLLLKEDFFDHYLKTHSFLQGQNTEEPKRQEALTCDLYFMPPENFVAYVDTITHSIDQALDSKLKIETK